MVIATCKKVYVKIYNEKKVVFTKLIKGEILYFHINYSLETYKYFLHIFCFVSTQTCL